MKVADIYAELGLKLTGDSQAELAAFERSLTNIANAARHAALALKILAKTPIPAGLKAITTSVVRATSTATTSATAVSKPLPPDWRASDWRPSDPKAVMGGPQPPMMEWNSPSRPSSAASPTPKQSLPTSALQGLKALGMIGLKLLGFGTLVLALKSIVSAMGRWLRASMEAVVSTELFSRQTGVSRKTLKEWELASTKAGLAEGEAASAIKMLAQKRQQILTTGEGATPFLQLGINALGTPEQVMREFQDRTRQMTEAQAVYWGSLIGFSEDFAAFLHSQKGPLKQLGDQVLSDKEQTNVTTLNAAWVELSATMGRLRDKIVADVSPALKSILDIVNQASTGFTLSKDLRGAAGKFLMGNPLGGTADLVKLRFGSGGGTTVNNDVSITVPGAGDPRATAVAVKAEIEKMNQSAYYQRHQILGEPMPQ